MKTLKFKNYIIALVLLLTLSSTYAQDNIKKIEQSMPYIQDQDLYFEIDYADKINVSYWDKDIIEIVAMVDLTDAKGKGINQNFDLQLNSKNGRHNIIATVLNQTAHYVLKKSGSDYKPKGAFSDKVLVVGTHIKLKIPKGVNLEFKGESMGDITVDHNGGGFLAATSGSIILYVDRSTKADLKLSSLFGAIVVADALNIEQDKPKNGLRKLSSREDLEYKLNGGGNLLISLTAFGDITILPKH